MIEINAIILAAGLGTRMKSRCPKVLHEILGRPMICPVVDLALALDPSRIVVVVGHGREAIQEALETRYPTAPLTFALQLQQLGTGHAVSCAVPELSPCATHVLVLYGDVPNLSLDLLRRLVEETLARKTPVGFLTARPSDPTGYGRVVRDPDGRVARIVEHKDAGPDERCIDEVNGGIYLIDREFMVPRIGSIGGANAAGELYLTDLVTEAARAGTPAHALCAPDARQVAGVNDRADLAQAQAFARQRFNRSLMEQGVTLVDPERTYIDSAVTMAGDVVVWPGAVLLGETAVETDVEIETGCVIRNTTIGQGSRVLAYSHVDGARLGPSTRIGPFARIRPESVIDARARVGNFVEVKKCTLGEDSKANHLSYLGDAVIGRRVNVGAGTITCNYDGQTKHRTVIEDDVFIGSDTQLVAPVTVKAGALIGAGTTVTRDVPAGALAISRSPQQNIEGYVQSRHKRDT